MKSILNNELESKVEKLKHMKLEVMQPKMKKNFNYQYLLERGGQGKLYLNTVTPTGTITFYFKEAVCEITQRYWIK